MDWTLLAWTSPTHSSLDPQGPKKGLCIQRGLPPLPGVHPKSLRVGHQGFAGRGLEDTCESSNNAFVSYWVT